ncbi:hypothetical protein A7J50_2215 [Pseudomonas antarctica]|uniref:Uncharacterized protein n=1 Tax=Pseudomonas antarctica TaxID=219572 RepID=A0A172YZP5_9PSED|nr:hypothetical protein [Pseudomonas antarctica]ANF85624.1 hypothetical protein A7J50_2215 [Pseudomonas antarctica]UXV21864.1 hypothetical protein N4P55_11075 [Pseudomonas fluorescens]
MRIFSWAFRKTTGYRHFALLDARHVCIAFKSCRAKPAGEQWVEVERVNLSWLGRTLPGCTRAVERVST